MLSSITRGNKQVQVIAIANQKGGVGKTTTTINVAASLSKLGRRVLIFDLDPQANATSGLGFSKDMEHSASEVLHDPDTVKQALIETPFNGLKLIPARPDLATAEVDLVKVQGRERLLEKALMQLNFDYVFIDCPPALGLLTVNALTAAQSVVIPVQAEYYAMEGLGQLLQTVQRIRQALNPELALLGVVLTMFDTRNSLSAHVKKELSHHLQGQIFKTLIPRNVRLAEAPSHGKPINAYDRWSKGAKTYTKLAKEIEARLSN